MPLCMKRQDESLSCNSFVRLARCGSLAGVSARLPNMAIAGNDSAGEHVRKMFPADNLDPSTQ